MKRIIAVILLAGMGSMHLLAQPGDGRGPRDRDGAGMDMIIEMLNLTPEQEQKFRQNHSDFRKQVITKRSAVDVAQVDLGDLMDADEPDRAAILRKMKEITDLRYEQKVAALDHMFAVREMLTPEQRELWKGHHRGRNHEGFKGESMHRFRPHSPGRFDEEED